MDLLTSDQFEAIFQRAIECDLQDRLELVHQVLPRAFVASFARLSSPSHGLRAALRELNRHLHLTNFADIPLAAWLDEAARMVEPRPQAEFFRQLAAELRRKHASPSNGHAAAPGQPALTPAELHELICRLMPHQLDVIMLRLGLPEEHIAPRSEPLSRRVLDVIQIAQQAGRLSELQAAVRQMMGG